MSEFKFKQFSVSQESCAMKINTDGVLLGALTEATQPNHILDIGTGTGVVAMMLAQRSPNSRVDAVEIDTAAAATAAANFNNSPFASRLTVFPFSFQEYFKAPAVSKYDLILSNPPFFLNSLKNSDKRKSAARHTNQLFFEALLSCAATSLSVSGKLALILPPDTARVVDELARAEGLYVHSTTGIKSFSHYPEHRRLLILGFGQQDIRYKTFVIYESEKIYSQQYVKALGDFLIIF